MRRVESPCAELTQLVSRATRRSPISLHDACQRRPNGRMRFVCFDGAIRDWVSLPEMPKHVEQSPVLHRLQLHETRREAPRFDLLHRDEVHFVECHLDSAVPHMKMLRALALIPVGIHERGIDVAALMMAQCPQYGSQKFESGMAGPNALPGSVFRAVSRQ